MTKKIIEKTLLKRKGTFSEKQIYVFVNIRNNVPKIADVISKFII